MIRASNKVTVLPDYSERRRRAVEILEAARKKGTEELPYVPSKLIRVALKDLEAVEKDKRYAVEMGIWHTPMKVDGRCHVCLAGAVIAKTLEIPPDMMVGPYAFLKAYDRLAALDNFRNGLVQQGLENMGVAASVRQKCTNSYFVPPYSDDPKKFKREMRRMAADFEEVGL